MVMALEAKIPVSGIQRLILQGTRGCKEGKHGKNVLLYWMQVLIPWQAALELEVTLTLSLGEPWGWSPTFSTGA